ncbi:MAG: hypothetical protein ACRDIY_11385, partial [Chloroflexota bacterium]
MGTGVATERTVAQLVMASPVERSGSSASLQVGIWEEMTLVGQGDDLIKALELGKQGAPAQVG